MDADLSKVSLRHPVTVTEVVDRGPSDIIAHRLRELGFVPGEPVQIVARGPFGGDPIVVEVGSTRFALRRAEAARIRVQISRGNTV